MEKWWAAEPFDNVAELNANADQQLDEFSEDESSESCYGESEDYIDPVYVEFEQMKREMEAEAAERAMQPEPEHEPLQITVIEIDDNDDNDDIGNGIDLHRKMEMSYEEFIIQRAIVVCGDDASVKAMHQKLSETDHSAGIIDMAMLEDERPRHLPVLRDFDSGYIRVLLMSAETWQTVGKELDYVLPKHNFLVLTGVDGEVEKEILTRVEDAYDQAMYPTLANWLRWKVEYPIAPSSDRPYYLLVDPAPAV
jgi:hypothetical protein